MMDNMTIQNVVGQTSVPKKRMKLFTTEYCETLEYLTEKLKKLFKEKGYELSDVAEIKKVSDKWIIIEREHLFSVSQDELIDELEEGKIKPEVKEVFEERGYNIEDGAKLSKEKEVWSLTQNKNRGYKIKVENEVLNIYDEREKKKYDIEKMGVKTFGIYKRVDLHKRLQDIEKTMDEDVVYLSDGPSKILTYKPSDINSTFSFYSKGSIQVKGATSQEELKKDLDKMLSKFIDRALPETDYLFCLDAYKYSENLKEGRVDQALKTALEDNDLSVSNESEFLRFKNQKDRWKLKEEDDVVKYVIEDKGSYLEVYDLGDLCYKHPLEIKTVTAVYRINNEGGIDLRKPFAKLRGKSFVKEINYNGKIEFELQDHHSIKMIIHDNGKIKCMGKGVKDKDIIKEAIQTVLEVCDFN